MDHNSVITARLNNPSRARDFQVIEEREFRVNKKLLHES